MSEALTSLAGFLRDHQERIVASWEQVSERDDHNEIVSKLTREEFRDNIGPALEGLCRALESSDGMAASHVAREEIEKHGHHRWKQGFSLQQLIRDWGHLDQALSGTISEYLHRHADRFPSADGAIAYARLAEFMALAMANSVKRYDDLRRAEAASIAKDLAVANEEFERLLELSENRSMRLREAVHDLRGTLSIIAVSAETLRREESESPEIIERLVRAAVTVGDMLSGMRELSELEAGDEPVDLREVDVAQLLMQLADEFDSHAANKGLRLIVEGESSLPVRTDATKVKRIFQNLLINAINYTGRGEIYIRWARAEDRWKFSVEDTGPGLQEREGTPIAYELDSPERASEAARTTGTAAYAGEGIGLTIVKRLCEALDAGFNLHSELGQGTRIDVDFPLG